MKYYLAFVKRISDGTEARECLAFNDIISAKSSAHTKVGSAMGDNNCVGAFAVVLNTLGQTLYSDSFERPTEET